MRNIALNLYVVLTKNFKELFSWFHKGIKLKHYSTQLNINKNKQNKLRCITGQVFNDH